MNEKEILKIFEEKKAILDGHFLLSSGLHSNRYIQCALVLQYPDIAEKLAKMLAKNLIHSKIDVVVSPALGGIIIGQELARQLNSRAIFTERVEEVMTLRRGFEIKKNEKVVVVEDVITTGKSTNEVIEVVKKSGGEVIYIACLVDRSGGKIKFDYPVVSLLKIDVQTWQKENCPLCKEGKEIVKPGSRGLK
jgi:orotate phosphoribosyltransferase